MQESNGHCCKHAFSLVELSIVLVILGLLVGGVLSGQSLIRAAELRSVSVEYQRYTTTVHTFRDKYFSFPGDIANATAFWGKDNINCTGDTGTTQVPGTCNGNNDGIINPTTREMWRFWQQLALAGLIEGTYSGEQGAAGAGNVFFAVPGTNVPRSKLSNAGWTAYYQPIRTAQSVQYDTLSGKNHYQYGTIFSPTTTQGEVFKPEELWNLDTKLDDAKPGIGKIIAINRSGFYAVGNTNACTFSTANNDINKSYNLESSAITCSMEVMEPF